MSDTEMSFQSAAGLGGLVQGAASTAAIADLLLAGLDVLETNREAAAHYITRACSALLKDKEPASADSARGGLVPWQLKRVKAFIEANLEKPLTVAELASVARLGPSYFQRAFRKSMGISVHAYLVQRRINRAQALMCSSDLPLSEIALATGFSDQAHFTMRFHRNVGVTPAAWRRERSDRRAPARRTSVGTGGAGATAMTAM